MVDPPSSEGPPPPRRTMTAPGPPPQIKRAASASPERLPPPVEPFPPPPTTKVEQSAASEHHDAGGSEEHKRHAYGEQPHHSDDRRWRIERSHRAPDYVPISRRGPHRWEQPSNLEHLHHYDVPQDRRMIRRAPYPPQQPYNSTYSPYDGPERYGPPPMRRSFDEGRELGRRAYVGGASYGSRPYHPEYDRVPGPFPIEGPPPEDERMSGGAAPVHRANYSQDTKFQPTTFPVNHRLRQPELQAAVVHLGDSLHELSKQILTLAKSLADVLLGERVDPDLFIDATTTNGEVLHLPPELMESNLNVNINMIAAAIVDAASHLSMKGTTYAALVALWNVDAARLPDGISNDDFDILKVKVQSEQPTEAQRRVDISVSKASWWIINSLVQRIVQHSNEKLEEFFRRGCLMECRALMRFICALTNCSVVEPSSALTLFSSLLSFGISGPLSGVVSETIITLVLSVLPWFTEATYNTCRSQFAELGATITAYLTSGQAASYPTILSPIWGHDVPPPVNSIEQMWETLLQLQAMTWHSKALLHVYNAAGLGPALEKHDMIHLHVVKPIDMDGDTIVAALERFRSIALDVATAGGSAAELELDLALEANSENYTRSAFEMGVGGGSAGQNGTWMPRTLISIWDNETLIRLLKGIKPLEDYEVWMLSDQCRAVLHSFRHSLELCSEVLLHIPLLHDQFELVLVETVFNEMLRLPHAAESPLFYFRLLDVMSRMQQTMRPSVHEAIIAFVRKCNVWDFGVLQIFSEFFSFWLSVLPDGPQSFDFTVWSPETIRAQKQQWLDLGHVLELPAVEVNLDSRHAEIQQQHLPYHLKEFLSFSLEKLSRLLWCDSLVQKLPVWLHPYISKRSGPNCRYMNAYDVYVKAKKEAAAPVTVANGVETAVIRSSWPVDLPLEYILFRRLLQIRFETDAHKRHALEKLMEIIKSRLLTFPHLLELPSEAFIEDALCRPANIADVRAISEHPPTKPEENNSSDNNRRSQLGDDTTAMSHEPLSIVKPEKVGDDDDVTMQATTDPSHVEVKVQQESLDYDTSTTPAWSLSDLLEILMFAVLGHGAKTLTHTLRVLENYSEILIGLRPSNISMAIDDDQQNPYKVESDDDTEFFDVILRVVFAFWRHCSVKCQHSIESLTRLNVVPVQVVQNFILQRLPLKRVGLLSSQEILFQLVRYSGHMLVLQQTKARRVKRSTMNLGGPKIEDDIATTHLLKISLSSLVASASSGTIQRLNLLHHKLANQDPFPFDDEISYLEHENAASDVVILSSINRQGAVEHFLRKLIHYARTFQHYLSADTKFEVEGCVPHIVETVQQLQNLRAYSFPNQLATQI